MALGKYRPSFKDLRKYLILSPTCVYTQKKNKFKKGINFLGPGVGNGKRVRKSAQKLINSVCGCPCIAPFLQTQCSVCNHFFKLSPMKLLWPALQLKATGQISLIFVVGLFWVWCKQLRARPRGNFDVALFARTIVTQLVEKVLAQKLGPETSDKHQTKFRNSRHGGRGW